MTRLKASFSCTSLYTFLAIAFVAARPSSLDAQRSVVFRSDHGWEPGSRDVVIAQHAASEEADTMFLGMRRRSIVNYTAVVTGVAAPYMGYKWWWRGNFHKFGFENDGFWRNYSYGVDKFGHAYTSYLEFNAVNDLMQWAHFDEETSTWTALAFSAGEALFLETGDGFSHFAFSTSDILANFSGIGFAYAQHKVPFLRHFTYKWSYYPSGIIPFDRDFNLTLDYDAHLYWLSADLHNLLPQPLDSYWPPYLNLAVGYGAKNVSTRLTPTVILPPGRPAHKYVIGIDYNFDGVPASGEVWDGIRGLLRYIHLPAPGVESISGEPVRLKPLLLN